MNFIAKQPEVSSFYTVHRGKMRFSFSLTGGSLNPGVPMKTVACSETTHGLYLFMMSRNSLLDSVCMILSSKNSMASTEFISASNLRSSQIR